MSRRGWPCNDQNAEGVISLILWGVISAAIIRTFAIVGSGSNYVCKAGNYSQINAYL